MAKKRRGASRRQFVQTGLSGAIALSAVGLGRSAQAQSTKPNIIFILADDLGFADVGCYGQRDYATPNIDRLAEEGLRFTQGYSNSPVCSATRTALITGRYQYRLPVGLEEPINPQSPKNIGLSPEHPTLPSLFKKLGYGTTLIGKWHLGFLPTFSPLKSGYDHFLGFFAGAIDYFRHGAGSTSQLFEQDMPVEKTGYMTNLLGDRAVQSIEGYARSKQPFMMSLHFNAPHWPWEGPDDEALSKGISNLRHYDGGTQKTYGAMVQAMDANIGRVMRALEDNGLARDTIVIFTSDNGGERFSKTWPFSGMKYELLEGGVRVPAIVRWPSRIAAGTVSDQVMLTMDWMPTLLSAAGRSPDPAFPSDGADLMPILTGKAPSSPRKIYWRFKIGAQRAIRDGDWKYLRIAGNEFLVDVVKDPRERANLKERHPEIFARLKGDWEAWNATMLPERLQPAVYDTKGQIFTDRYGVNNPPAPSEGGPALLSPVAK